MKYMCEQRAPLLSSFPCSSLEYDPRFYGLYLHDDSILPTTASMWDHLDAVAPGYQDSLVMHMLHKPIEVSFNQDPDRLEC